MSGGACKEERRERRNRTEERKEEGSAPVDGLGNREAVK